jgi:PAS domain S-box-containing protein
MIFKHCLSLLSDKNADGVNLKPHRQKRKDGANIFVEVNRLQINYKNKPAYLNTIKNIDDRLKLEQEKQNFNSLFNDSSDLFFITDSKGFIKAINKSVTEVLGYTKDIIDASLPSLLVDGDRGRINSAVFIKGIKEKLISEVSFKKAGKEGLKIILNITPVLNYKNEVESYNILGPYVKEITKEIIKEIPVEKESIISSVPEVNFLSGIFHDLLTPINVILGFVQDLTDNIENPTSEQEEALQIINQNRSNLLELINHIVEFLQTEKGEVKLNLVRVKIIDIIEEVKGEDQ